MIDLLLFPFKLVWEIVCFVFDLVMGLIGLAFGLAGGIIGLVVKLCLLGAVIAIAAVVIQHLRQKPEKPQDEDFISYYDKDAVK